MTTNAREAFDTHALTEVAERSRPAIYGGIALNGYGETTQEGWLDLLDAVIEVSDYPNRLAQVEGMPTSYEEVRARERNWFIKGYNGIMGTVAELDAMGKGDTPIDAYFDIDQTITEGGMSDRLVRPAFPLFVAAMRQELGERFNIGTLTTLNPWHPDIFDVCFAGIDKAMIQPDLVLWTRQYAWAHPELKLEPKSKGEVPDEELVEGLSDVLDPMLYQAVTDGITDMDGRIKKLSIHKIRDPDGKLEIVKHRRALHPERAVAFFDNLITAGVLRSDDPLLRGYHVGPEVQSELYSAQRTRLDALKQEYGIAR